MEANKIKETLYKALIIVGILAGCAVAWYIFLAIWWGCYYAGIPM